MGNCQAYCCQNEEFQHVQKGQVAAALQKDEGKHKGIAMAFEKHNEF
jgi:hypothetical protein